MNQLNHFLFSFFLLQLFYPNNFLENFVFSLSSLLLDLDHYFTKKPWYKKRSWVQEPFGFLFIGLPLAFFCSFIKNHFFWLVVIPYLSHLTLDYLCIFETYPLAPFLEKIRKKEGFGIFIPDSLFPTENSKKWKIRVRKKKIKGISENYFSAVLLILILAELYFQNTIFKLFL